MKVHGHRGYSSKYPENTILAFEKAKEYGADGIELDVRRTSDGIYIIMHDPTVDRTTDGTGSVDSLTYEYISSLDAGTWKGEMFTNIKVPTLEEVLTKFKSVPNFEINLHLNLPRDQIYGALDIAIDKGMEGQCYVFSGDNILLDNAKQYNSAFKCITGGMPTIESYSGFLDWAVLKNLDFVSYNAFSNSESDLLAMANNIHSQGKKAYASYIYNKYEELVPMHLNAGTDIVLVDDVGLTVDLINHRSDYVRIPYHKSVPYARVDGSYVRLSMYGHNGTSYINLS